MSALHRSQSIDCARVERIRAGLLRELADAPVSEWPDALVQCVDSLSAVGVAPRASSTTFRDWTPSPQVRHICVFMSAHYDQPISCESLAARVGRNTAYIATLFRRQTGTTIHRYLTRIRMRRAAALLRRSEKVEAVMLLVGYRSKKNFYRQFESAFGVTPGMYKIGHARR